MVVALSKSLFSAWSYLHLLRGLHEGGRGNPVVLARYGWLFDQAWRAVFDGFFAKVGTVLALSAGVGRLKASSQIDGGNWRADRMAPKTIDEYIAAFPPEVQAILRKIRATIKKAAPDAEERISYQMPTFTLNGPLVYFGAFKKHIGLYPPVRGDENLMGEISIYEGEKGNLRFPLDKPIPYALISKIVKVRIRENQGGVGTKQRSK
jgi:uncharacterized protein YdhG (YjbR/CyaY superfamily)